MANNTRRVTKDNDIVELLTETTNETTPVESPKEVIEITEETETPKSPKTPKSTRRKPEKIARRTKAPDQRPRIIVGLLIILVGIFLSIAFGGYIFDRNITGEFGEIIGQFLTEQMFGIGSAFLIFIIFHFGNNLVFRGPKISQWKIWKYALMMLVWLPLCLALIFNNIDNYEEGHFDFLCGTVGDVSYNFLLKYIADAGIILLLLFGLGAYLFYTFNFDINKLVDSFKNKDNDVEEDKDVEKDEDVEEDEEIIASPQDDDTHKFENVRRKDSPKEETDEENTINLEIEEKDEEPEEKIVEIIPAFEIKDGEITPAEQQKVADDKQNQSKDDDIIIEIEEVKEEKKKLHNGDHITMDIPLDPKWDLPDYVFPSLDLLRDYDDNIEIKKEELEENKNKIVTTLANFGIRIDKIKATVGPTVTLYEIIPEAGTKISRIRNLQDDIALSLAAMGIRIIAPMPGRGTIGIEVPNKTPKTVSMKSVLASEKFQKTSFTLPFAIGKTISNESYVADLAKMPHILMAGATGQGKSVGLNAIIASLLYCKHPSELKFVFIDPKKVELSLFRKLERHYLAKLPDAPEAVITDVKQVVRTLNSLCIEMDTRYDLLKDAEVKTIKEYNAKFAAHQLSQEAGHHFMPYIVLVIDEFADLIMTAGREIEAPIARLAQLARAIGIHLIIATQRPSVKVITGNIKNNFPARIAFRVISRVDSGTILDNNGAEQLVGKGDLLMSTGQDLVRMQCPFIDTPEIEAIIDHISNQRGFPEAFMLPEVPDDTGDGGFNSDDVNPNERDSKFEEAARIIVQTQQGSTSMLQRKMGIGFARAGRIIDQLETAGIVGKAQGSKPREVKIATEAELDIFLNNLNFK